MAAPGATVTDFPALTGTCGACVLEVEVGAPITVVAVGAVGAPEACWRVVASVVAAAGGVNWEGVSLTETEVEGCVEAAGAAGVPEASTWRGLVRCFRQLGCVAAAGAS